MRVRVQVGTAEIPGSENTMPPLHDADLVDYAVVWAKTGVDGYGNPIVSSPIELYARWLKNEVTITSPFSESVQRDATIALPQDVPEGSIVWEGTLAEWDTEYALGTGTHDPNLYVVHSGKNTKDIKGIDPRYEFNLQRWRQELPAVV